MKIDSWKQLEVYQVAFELQQAVFRHSKKWPREETFSLTDQVRRASRSIGANLAEAWARRRYPDHFLSKLTDADAELKEAMHWISTANAFGYLTLEQSSERESLAATVGRPFGSMINRHDSFCF